MRTSWFVALAIAALVGGCWRDFGCEGGEAPSPAVIAVGTRSYSEADLQVRMGLENYLHPQGGQARLGAAQQLIHGALLQEALFRLGCAIGPQDVDAEVTRIFAETKSPERLDIMERIGGGRAHRNFRELVILPDFANNRYYYGIYPMHPGVHHALRQRARAVLTEIQAEGAAADLKRRADGMATTHDQVAFTARRGFYRETQVADPKPRSALGEAGETSLRLEDQVFAKLAVGAVHGEVVELSDALVILRWTGWLDESAGVRGVERLIFPKRSADEHLFELVADVPVHIADAALEQSFKQQIPWASRLKWSP